MPTTGAHTTYPERMGKWVHRLSEVDQNKRTAICAACGPVTVVRTGAVNWRCKNAYDHQKRHAYGERGVPPVPKKDHCERCGLMPEHPVQLDRDHIDGDRSNNASENIQTLCANCHRLKSWHERIRK